MAAGSIGEAVITVGADASDLASDVEKKAKGPLAKAGDAVGKAFGDALTSAAKLTGLSLIHI